MSDNAWRTAEQMAEAWGVRVWRVTSYIKKLGLHNDSGNWPAHTREDGDDREYSPAAQGLIKREWRSYGSPR